mgnify:CR=1 FL=1
MIKNKLIAFCLFSMALFIVASCAVAPHPNEKIIVGIWRPLKVEKIVDSSAILAAKLGTSDTTVIKNNPRPGKTAVAGKVTGKGDGSGNGSRKVATLDRLVQSLTRSTMEIYANKTAVINFPGSPLHATWKMKGKGTRLVAKNVSTKLKFVIEILDISQDEIVVLEHAPVGDVKITYGREK